MRRTTGLPEGGLIMGHAVAFFEVISPDHQRAQRFYGELFCRQVAAGRERARLGAGGLPSLLVTTKSSSHVG
jgi:hypothetical protein